MASLAKRPDGAYRARYRGPDRKERSKHFGRKTDAQRWLAGIEVSKTRGEWLDPALSRVTVGTWCPIFMDAQAQLKPTTRLRYEGIIARQILPTWEKVPLAQVTPADVAKWVGKLSASGLSAASVRYAHRVLALALKYAVLDGRLARNPADGVPLPRAKSRPKRFLSHAEVESLAAECGEYGPLVFFLAYTGLRWGESSALQVSDLDLLRRRVHVNRAMAEVRGKAVVGTPKDHERREVPVPAFLAEMLMTVAAGKAPDALVFPTLDGQSFLRNGNFRGRVFDAAAERAGLVGITPHGLRHTAASLAVQAGASVVLVQRMLGHSSPSVTLDVYSHLFADDLDTVADRLNEAKIKAGADPVRTYASVIKLSQADREARNAV